MYELIKLCYLFKAGRLKGLKEHKDLRYIVLKWNGSVPNVNLILYLFFLMNGVPSHDIKIWLK